LPDRALFGAIVYSFGRVSAGRAVVGMNTEDYYQQGKQWWITLRERGGKHREVSARHKPEDYFNAYL